MVMLFAVAGVLGAGAGQASAETPPVAYANGVKLSTTKVPLTANGEIQLHSTVLGKITCQNTFYAQGWNEGSSPSHAYGEVLGWGTSSCTAPEELKSLEAADKKQIEEGKILAPLTVFASSEMPVEKTVREGSVCAVEKKVYLSECPNASERVGKNYIAKFARRVSSLPWKLEIIRGERSEEAGILQKIGLAAFGESGTATGHSTKCYPTEKVGSEVQDANWEVVPAGCIAVNIVFPQIPLEFVFYGSQEVWAINGAGNGLNTSRLEFKESGTLFTSEGLEGEGSTTGKVKISGAESVQLMTAK
jgi:hypothetical protein